MARMIPNFDLARTVSIKASDLIASLDRLGDQNWELTSVFGSREHEIYYFKRSVEQWAREVDDSEGIIYFRLSGMVK
jgi:hypothetical protein